MDDWIYWHLFTIIINYNSSQSMAKTHSIPFWTTSVFSSTVTDFVLIYESVTFSTATALNDTVLRMTPTEFTNELSFITSGEPNMSPCLTVRLLLCYSIASETCASEPLASSGLPCLFLAARTRVWRAVG
jgi:hypothetical protein